MLKDRINQDVQESSFVIKVQPYFQNLENASSVNIAVTGSRVEIQELMVCEGADYEK